MKRVAPAAVETDEWKRQRLEEEPGSSSECQEEESLEDIPDDMPHLRPLSPYAVLRAFMSLLGCI